MCPRVVNRRRRYWWANTVVLGRVPDCKIIIFDFDATRGRAIAAALVYTHLPPVKTRSTWRDSRRRWPNLVVHLATLVVVHAFPSDGSTVPDDSGTSRLEVARVGGGGGAQLLRASRPRDGVQMVRLFGESVDVLVMGPRRTCSANHVSASRHVSDSQPITSAPPATSVTVNQSRQHLPPRL